MKDLIKRKSSLVLLVSIISLVIINFGIFYPFKQKFKKLFWLEIELQSSMSSFGQIAYNSLSWGSGYFVNKGNNKLRLFIKNEIIRKGINEIRIDPSIDWVGHHILIKGIKLFYREKPVWNLNFKDIEITGKNHLKSINIDENSIELITSGDDPYFIFGNIPETKNIVDKMNWEKIILFDNLFYYLFRIIILVLIVLSVLFFYFKYKSIVFGILIIFIVSLYCFGASFDFNRFAFDNVINYSKHPIHRLTSRAMLEGKLYFPQQLTLGIENDLQVYNGAKYTNWGYGVPLLQLPFHFIGYLIEGTNNKAVFFPDRLIFLLYLFGAILSLCFSLKKAFRELYHIENEILSSFLTTSFVLFILTYAVFWLMSLRFLVYEETIAYLVVIQLYILSFYVFYTLSKKNLWLFLGGMVAGIGLLIRGTGLIYFLVWVCLFFLIKKNLKKLTYFIFSALPFVIFWFYSNYFKAGSILSLGYHNTNPGRATDFELIRFGSACNNSIYGIWDLFVQIFYSLFIGKRSFSVNLTNCNFTIEELGQQFVPFIGIGFLILLIVVFLCYVFLLRKRFDVFLPYIGIGVILVGFVFAGSGLAYRYAGDLWPFMFLILVQFCMFNNLEKKKTKKFIVLVCIILPIFSTYKISCNIGPQLPSILATDNSFDAPGMWNDHILMRWNHYYFEKDLLNRINCQDPQILSLPYNRYGWHEDCSIGEITNFYIGVPQKNINRYKLNLLMSSSNSNLISNNLISDILDKSLIVPKDRWGIDKNNFTIEGKTKSVLFQHPPSTIAYPVVIPPKAMLSFSIAMSPGCWSPAKGDGVCFKVNIRENDSIHQVFSKTIDPKNNPKDRRWFNCSVDLSRYENKELFLILETDPLNGSVYDWAGWAEIMLSKKITADYNPTVYINGKYYKGTWRGNRYEVEFPMDYRDLISPNIVVSLDWGKVRDIRLLSAELE